MAETVLATLWRKLILSVKSESPDGIEAKSDGIPILLKRHKSPAEL